MPKSKSKRRKYQPPPKPKPKPSPRWYGPVVLSILFSGVIVILLNYLGLIPGTSGQARNFFLWLGLGLIAAGFGASTRLR
ncbi:MAG: cell division protein CrgA [Actinomycetota bacterium]